MQRLWMPVLSLTTIVSLGLTPPTETGSNFAKQIEKAQDADAYREHQAVSADIVVHFGGNQILEGKMLFDTPVGKSRIDLKDGGVIVFDGNHAWVTPADSPVLPKARFHALTWPYFLAAPFKLQDPGVHLQTLGPADLRGTTCQTAKLTFDAGTGDAPDDWYVLYRDPKTDYLKAMAYIVTYGKPKAEAEKDPHAVVYDNFKTIDGVTLPMTWTFYNWNPKDGVHGDPIGKVEIANLKFTTPARDAFTKPDGAAESKLPGAG